MSKLAIVFTILVLSVHCFGKENNPKKHILHWGINLEPVQFFKIAARRFQSNVHIRTNGGVKVKLTFNQYKQDERNHLKDIQNGVYDMAQDTTNNLQKVVPEMKIWELPFLFESDDHVFSFSDSKEARKLLDKFSKEEVYAVNHTYAGGFIHMFGPKLESLADLGKKVLMIEDASKAYRNLLKNSFGLKKVVDYDTQLIKETNHPSELISSVLDELYENADGKNITLNTTRHRLYTRVLFISQKFLKSLPKKYRKIVIDEANKAAIFERELSLEASNYHLENIKNNVDNISLNTWSIDKRRKYRKSFLETYSAYEKKYKNGLIDNILNKSYSKRTLASQK